MDTNTKKMIDKNDKADKDLDNKIENVKERAKLSGCEMTDGQILFLLAELEKEWAFNSYLHERGLEFVNERTRESIAGDFEKLIFVPENKDKEFEELLDSLVKDENGEFIWDLFSPESGKKNRLAVEVDGDMQFDISKILPPCGDMDISEKNNPFDKDNWNMAAQSKIYKENPDIAKYLASAAKQKK